MNRIDEYELMGKRIISFTIDEANKEAFAESEEMKAMKKLVSKLNGNVCEEPGRPVMRKELRNYTRWSDVNGQIRCVDSRIDRRDRLLAAVAAVAVAALVIAIHAVV